MAQTNYTPISLYYSTTASAVPTAANLVQGELAINTNDGKLYYEDSSGVVRVLASKSTGSIGGSNTQVQFNNSGSLGGSSGLTWDGSFLTTSSIKNTALTSGRVTYASTSGLLSDSANLLWDAGNSKLTVKSTALATVMQLTDDTNYGANFTGLAAGLNLAMNGSQTFCITGGNVGVGTTSPTAKLDVSGNIVMTGVAWTAYTPTITAGSGTFTTVSATGKYYIFGKTCTLNMIVDITAAGTATGFMSATLPFTSAGRIQIGGYGMEVNVTGSMLKGYIPASSTALQVTTYANATTIGSGFSNILTVVYEIA